jgi:hypothetical protein
MTEDKKTTSGLTPERQRNKRKPFGGARLKLNVETQLEGYHYRWVNDEPGRIAGALAGDYTFAEPSEVGREESEDSRVKELVGTNKDGSSLYAFLMRIPLEYYYEDQKEKQSYLDDIDRAIKGGEVAAHSSDKRYTPKGGISIKN